VDEAQKKLINHIAVNGTQLNPQAKNALEVLTDSYVKVTKEKDELRESLEATRQAASQHQTRAAQLESVIAEMKIEAARQEDGLESMRKKLATLAAHERAQAQALTEKDVQIQQDRADLQAHFLEREVALRREMESQQSSLKEREAVSRAQRNEILARTQQLESEHATLQKELKQRAAEHEKAIADLVRQKEQYEAEFQDRMESKAAEYVDTALGSLKTNEERFDSIGSKWAVGGLLGVLIGLVLAYFLTTEATEKIVSNKDISWSLFLLFGV
jgi:hypothetical protein